jgi:peptide/nickel transport system ATP-binding protein
MKDGLIVETGTADEVFGQPSEPYTRQLIDALPSLDVA